jgi:hypothetical protein
MNVFQICEVGWLHTNYLHVKVVGEQVDSIVYIENFFFSQCDYHNMCMITTFR